MEHNEKQILQLPVLVSTRTDVGRLRREVEALENFMSQAAVRTPGTTVKMPKTSRLMDEIISLNKINPLLEDDRQRLQSFLMEVHAKAPVLHMSFSADPSPMFMQKLTTWLRKEIHPLVLVQIGLQPNIGAGCVVRTTNKYFDFSLREFLKAQRPLLMQKLEGTKA